MLQFESCMEGIFPDVSQRLKIKNFNSCWVSSFSAEIESNFCVHTFSTETNDDIDAVLENFPVIYFSNNKKSVLVDFHDLYLIKIAYLYY